MSIINLLPFAKKCLGLLPPLSKHTRYARWRLLSLSVFGLTLAGALWTGYFIYQNLFFTLANVNAIVVLSNNLTMDIVDLPGFQKAQGLISQKNNLPPLTAKVRNVFFYAPTSTPATTTKK